MNRLYSKLLFALLTCSLSYSSEAQVVIANNDTAICEGSSFNIHADINGRTPVYIPFAQNNVHSGVINIGFNFTFYGTAYNQCVVSPNGVISFNLANANQPADNVIDQAMPGEVSMYNSIMAPWVALDIAAGGTVDYATIGTIPNRRFVVTYCSIPLFGCNNVQASFQVILNEGTNTIDMHIVNNPAGSCLTFNSGRSIQGVQNATGAFATTVTGRNFPSIWSATEDSYRFTPNGPNSYTVASIQHTNIPDATATIRWYAGNFQVGTGPDFNYTYVTNQTLIARVANCPDTSADTISVVVNQVYNILSADSTNPSQCEAADGTITLFGLFPGETYEVHYTDPFATAVTVTLVADNAGGVTITGLVEGNYTNFYVISSQGCRSNTYLSVPLYDDAIVIGGANAVLPSSCNGTNGGITLTGLVPGVTYTVNYDFNTVTYTLILTADGSGNVLIPNLGAGTYSNINATTTACNSNVVGPVTIADPLPVIASATGNSPTLCRGMDGFIVLTGLLADSNYVAQYTVNGATYSVPVIADANGEVTIPNLGAGLYSSITVQLLNCKSAQVGPVTIVNPAITADFTFIVEPGCTEDRVLFTDISTGSAYPFQYAWSFDDSNKDSVQHPVHIYDEQGTYSVTLIITDSVCRDTVTHDVVIDHPLVANFTVDNALICQFGSVTVTDASTATPPTSYYWDFDNGDINSFGVPTATSTFAHPGDYNVMLVVTDFIGCKDTAYELIRVDSLTEIHVSFSDSTLCAGEKVTIAATYADTGSTGVNWDFGDGIITTTGGHDIDHAYETAGLYSIHVVATGRVCPDVDSMLLLTVLPQPHINIGPDTSICPASESLVLQDLVNGGNSAASWKWMQGMKVMDEKSFNIAITEPGTYSAVVSLNGCSAADTVDVLKDCYIDAPNAFTPGGDNMNDYFMPRQLVSKGVVKFKMQIFNRWGQELYSTTNIDGRGWDGKLNDVPQPQGVYVYLIEVTMRNGVQERKQGNVTLLR